MGLCAQSFSSLHLVFTKAKGGSGNEMQPESPASLSCFLIIYSSSSTFNINGGTYCVIAPGRSREGKGPLPPTPPPKKKKLSTIMLVQVCAVQNHLINAAGRQRILLGIPNRLPIFPNMPAPLLRGSAGVTPQVTAWELGTFSFLCCPQGWEHSG